MPWELVTDRPIYTQLTETLRLRIVNGQYPPGSRLPSVRELALEAGVNPNTMQRALTDLESSGLVAAHRTSGRFVTEDAALLAAAKREQAERWARECLQQMERLGYGSKETADLILTLERSEPNE